MTKAYNAKRDKSWAAKFTVPFEKQDDGTVVGKANIKATFGDRPTGIPAQFYHSHLRSGQTGKAGLTGGILLRFL